MIDYYILSYNAGKNIIRNITQDYTIAVTFIFM